MRHNLPHLGRTCDASQPVISTSDLVLDMLGPTALLCPISATDSASTRLHHSIFGFWLGKKGRQTNLSWARPLPLAGDLVRSAQENTGVEYCALSQSAIKLQSRPKIVPKFHYSIPPSASLAIFNVVDQHLFCCSNVQWLTNNRKVIVYLDPVRRLLFWSLYQNNILISILV